MKLNKIILALSVLFFAIMTFVTAASRNIHNQSLCKVEIIEIKKQDFNCRFLDEEGNECYSKRRAIGIPKLCVENDIYIIGETEVYGESRQCANRVEILLFDDYFSDEYYAVSFGLSVGDNVIVSNEQLCDGVEILIDERCDS